MSQIIHGEPILLTRNVRRITAPNPGVMTGPGTNTYLIGSNELALIDPGPNIECHIDCIMQTIAETGGTLRWILCTHTHLDHSPGANKLRELTGAIVGGMLTDATNNQDANFKPDQYWCDGDYITTDNFVLKAIHTPGHASNHLCFYLEQDRLLFTGDHIMEGSTVVIAPPDGDMKDYLESLQRLKSFPLQTLAPAHGELITQPLGVIEGLIEHRLMREDKVLDGLETLGPASLDQLTPTVYNDVPPFLHPIARYSLQAHLEKLQKDGQASEHNGQWQVG